METGPRQYNVFSMVADTCEWFSYRCQLYLSVFSVLVSSYTHRPFGRICLHSFSMCNCILIGLFIIVFVCEMFSEKKFTSTKQSTVTLKCNRSLCVCLVAVSLSHSCLTISTPLAGNGGKSTNGWYEKD